jgi:hypothetical protein
MDQTKLDTKLDMMKVAIFFSLLFSTASAFTVTTPKAFTATRRFKIDQIRRK